MKVFVAGVLLLVTSFVHASPVKTLVFLFHLDDEAPAAVTPADIAAEMAVVDQFYQANSYGAVSIKASVTDWLTIPSAGVNRCDVINSVPAIEDAAVAAGWSPSRYARKIFIRPLEPTCWWIGMASIGDTSAYFNGVPIPGVIAHELGHNFGAWHSHGEFCNSTGCTLGEYDDQYCIMGVGHYEPLYQMTAYQKQRLGWLGFSGPQKILQVTTSGVYDLTPYESGRGVKALFWRQPGFGDSGGLGYYVELRAGVGLLIHTGGQCLSASCFQAGNDSVLKDLDPGDGVDRVLDVGQTYVGSGVTFTAVGPSSVQVTIP